jgi:hypothetical protein
MALALWARVSAPGSPSSSRPVSMVSSHYPGRMKRSPTRRVLPEHFPKCGIGTVGPPWGLRLRLSHISPCWLQPGPSSGNANRRITGWQFTDGLADLHVKNGIGINIISMEEVDVVGRPPSR